MDIRHIENQDTSEIIINVSETNIVDFLNYLNQEVVVKSKGFNPNNDALVVQKMYNENILAASGSMYGDSYFCTTKAYSKTIARILEDFEGSATFEVIFSVKNEKMRNYSGFELMITEALLASKFKYSKKFNYWIYVGSDGIQYYIEIQNNHVMITGQYFRLVRELIVSETEIKCAISTPAVIIEDALRTISRNIINETK